ncbi:MAG TPA: YncE family protein [Solirubrobacteraceae bacterium]|nr:YncE family protein [Solirubrobacteraceae bacterium]
MNSVIGTIPVGNGAGGVGVDPIRGTVYVANQNYNEGLGTVSVIDEATNSVTATVTVGDYPYRVAVDPFAGTAYVDNFLSDSVSVIDERTNTVIATIPLPGGPAHDMAIDPYHGLVYIAEGQTVQVISEKTKTVVDSITMPLSTDTVGVDPATGQVFVGEYTGTMAILSERTNRIIRTIATGFNTYLQAIGVDSTTGTVYVGTYATIGDDQFSGPGSVAVFDEHKDAVTRTIATDGNGPSGIAVDPLTHTVYATNYDYESPMTASVVSVIDGRTDTLTANVPVGVGPAGVDVDPIRGRLYSANNGTGGSTSQPGTVSVIKVGPPTLPFGLGGLGLPGL